MRSGSVDGVMGIAARKRSPSKALAGCEIKTSHSRRMEVNQVATVRQQASGGYQVTVTETEFALIKSALAEAERVSRFAIEVLDEADQARDAEPAENSRLRREIEDLAMREASLKWLQKTMSENNRAGKSAPTDHADLDQLTSSAALLVPPPRRGGSRRPR